jgi:hypothetical protein
MIWVDTSTKIYVFCCDFDESDMTKLVVYIYISLTAQELRSMRPLFGMFTI